MRTIFYVLLLIIAWWVGASGLYAMDDATGTITTITDTITERISP